MRTYQGFRSACSYDGKPVGAATGLERFKGKDGGPSNCRGLRRKMANGDAAAMERLKGHARKWLSRGMPAARVAKRLGLQVSFIRALTTPPVDATAPRLVKTGGTHGGGR